MTVRFAEPPPRWSEEAAEKREAMKAKPGEWIIWCEDRPHAPGGTIQVLQRQGFETTTRTRNGLTTLYARWPKPTYKTRKRKT